MSEEGMAGRPRYRRDAPAAGQYTSRDFQLEVLERLEEMQEMTASLEESWNKKLEEVKEQRLVKFDSRAMIALGAVALSIAGYVIESARGAARQDSEVEATKARVLRLEQISATNTEARVRTEVRLDDLRAGQDEIKTMIEAHDSASRKVAERK